VFEVWIGGFTVT